MLQQLETLYKEARQSIESINEAETLSAWEPRYIGRKGAITLLLRSVGQLPKDERAAFGQRANAIRDELTTLYEARVELIRQRELAQSLEEGEIDVTLPVCTGTSLANRSLDDFPAIKRLLWGYRVAKPAICSERARLLTEISSVPFIGMESPAARVAL